ncbi:MAG: hypothetical protein EXX96DRAFT_544741 [Benjaminiella poitrasii]|nr:MAG: hypothetical protein EXX96DRAFT_544741 [Benjaminiella poitrasii]
MTILYFVKSDISQSSLFQILLVLVLSTDSYMSDLHISNLPYNKFSFIKKTTTQLIASWSFYIMSFLIYLDSVCITQYIYIHKKISLGLFVSKLYFALLYVSLVIEPHNLHV